MMTEEDIKAVMGTDKPDMVNSPPHYNQGDIECIDAIKAALGHEGFIAYCRGNSIKYLWRTGHKGDAAEQLGKAMWYQARAQQEINNQKERK